MARKWADLKAMSDKDLVKEHDEIAPRTVIGTNYYRDELHHRMIARRTIEPPRVSRRVFYLSPATATGAS